MIFTHGSVFSGIGGWSLASDEMGWETRFNCEINPFGQKVLKYYWPNAELYEDITKTDFKKWGGRINILSNSFPCQGFSVAGKRKGTEDNRFLWPESLRAIKEIQPDWVVSENVPGIITIEKGMVFEQVQTDLEAAGYEVFTFVLPACGVNAPHKRERTWFVAHNNIRNRKNYGLQTGREINDNSIKAEPINTNPSSDGLQGRSNSGELRSQREKREQRSEDMGCFSGKDWQDFPTQSPLCGRNDGFSRKLDGITFSNWKRESIKAYGNAIVPAVAIQIFKAIEEYESLNNQNLIKWHKQ